MYLWKNIFERRTSNVSSSEKEIFKQSWFKGNFLDEKVNRGKSKGCVWWSSFIESHWNVPLLYSVCSQLLSSLRRSKYLFWKIRTTTIKKEFLKCIPFFDFLLDWCGAGCGFGGFFWCFFILFVGFGWISVMRKVWLDLVGFLWWERFWLDWCGAGFGFGWISCRRPA